MTAICLSLYHRVCSYSWPLSQWSYPTISSSVAHFSACPQHFPASGSFPLSQLFSSCGQSVGASASASVLPVIQGWSLGLTWFDFLAVQGTLKSFLQHHNLKATIWHSACFTVQHTHLYMITGKTITWNIWTFVNKVMPMCFFIIIIFSFIFTSWTLITLQYCSGFCHTLTWISHGFTCVPHPDTSSHLPLYPIPLGLPSAPALSSCIQPGLASYFTLDNIHVSMLFSQIIPPLSSPIESKTLFYTFVSLFLSCI